MCHCSYAKQHNDIKVTSQWARWRLTFPASRLFAQPLVQKENSASLFFVRVIHRWPAVPLTNDQLHGNVSIWWRHHDVCIWGRICNVLLGFCSGWLPLEPSWFFSLTFSGPIDIPDSKVHGANMRPIWGRQDPGGSHVDPMKFVILDHILRESLKKKSVRPSYLYCGDFLY